MGLSRTVLDPALDGFLEGENFFSGEPQADFTLSTLRRVRTVDDVHANGSSEIATDRTGSSVNWVCFAHHSASSCDYVVTLPYHCEYWTGSDEVNQFTEERTLFVLCIMLFSQFAAYCHQLSTYELVAFFSKRDTISPIRLRCTPSGFTIRNVFSIVCMPPLELCIGA